MRNYLIQNKFKNLIDGLSNVNPPSYVYCYPPKRTYRDLPSNINIEEYWRDCAENFNLYLHIPFCEMKCNFCNLFATTSKSKGKVDKYVECLVREIRLYSKFLLNKKISSIYFGGGTPTTLSVDNFVQIFTEIDKHFIFSKDIEISVEATPNSIDKQNLIALKSIGFNRLSIGVQTFQENELIDTARTYDVAYSKQAVEDALNFNFPNVNIDLIYGLPSQTKESWIDTLRIATELKPHSITMYPLMIRSLTNYGKQEKSSFREFHNAKTKYEWYSIAVEKLLQSGYEQTTFINYSLPEQGGCSYEKNEYEGIPTCGIGAGARSYTKTLHYSTNYAIENRTKIDIIDNYMQDIMCDKFPAKSGYLLDQEEQKRRYIIFHLFSTGIDRKDYFNKFNETLESVFIDELSVLINQAYIVESPFGLIKLTDKGIKLSNLVANLFFSENILNLESKYSEVI